jgi:hypothetical protein
VLATAALALNQVVSASALLVLKTYVAKSVQGIRKRQG